MYKVLEDTDLECDLIELLPLRLASMQLKSPEFLKAELDGSIHGGVGGSFMYSHAFGEFLWRW